VVFISGLEEGVFPALRDGDLTDELEEERRLAYVAITRARDRLMLTWARLRRSDDQIRRNEPSRFLANIPAAIMARRGRLPRARRGRARLRRAARGPRGARVPPRRRRRRRSGVSARRASAPQDLRRRRDRAWLGPRPRPEADHSLPRTRREEDPGALCRASVF